MEGLAVRTEGIWTIFVEESNLRGASWATGEPENKWVCFGVISGLEPPIEDIIRAIVAEFSMGEVAVVNGDEA